MPLQFRDKILVTTNLPHHHLHRIRYNSDPITEQVPRSASAQHPLREAVVAAACSAAAADQSPPSPPLPLLGWAESLVRAKL